VDAVCAQYGKPEGVVRRRQVCTNSVDPNRLSRRWRISPSRSLSDSLGLAGLADDGGAGHLLAEDDGGAALADEAVELGPQVPLVVGSFPLARRGERLTGRASRKAGSVVRPTGESEGEGPAADSAEEMALNVSSKVSCRHLRDAPLIHIPLGYQPAPDEFPQPLRRVGVELVVIAGHFRP
jgi:hypothetical protein